jgi:ribosome recycling factor
MYNFSNFKTKLNQIIEHLQQDISFLRTSKASTKMLDPIKVHAYGTVMAINELANVSTPDNNLIVIDPWDKNLLEDIEKAIQKSSLNLNPVVDKEIIRIVIPSLTEEKRMELVKQLQQKVESTRAMMRSARTEAKGEIEDLEGEAGVSEDDIHRDLEELDKIMGQFEKQMEDIQEQKKQDLLSL